MAKRKSLDQKIYAYWRKVKKDLIPLMQTNPFAVAALEAYRTKYKDATFYSLYKNEFKAQLSIKRRGKKGERKPVTEQMIKSVSKYMNTDSSLIVTRAEKWKRSFLKGLDEEQNEKGWLRKQLHKRSNKDFRFDVNKELGSNGSTVFDIYDKNDNLIGRISKGYESKGDESPWEVTVF